MATAGRGPRERSANAVFAFDGGFIPAAIVNGRARSCEKRRAMTGAQDAIPRTTVAASQATLLNCLALARRRDTEGVALLEFDRRRRAADGTAGGQQVEVVGLGRDATGAGGAAHSPVKHARPDDDCRSDVEVGLGSATGSEDVELSVLPVLRQIE